MNFSKSPALADCCCSAIVRLSSAMTIASRLTASPRTISSSTAWRRKCACWASRTSIRLTTVAYCGKTSTRPSSLSRISASRIGVELTPNCPAKAARDSGDPGGSSSEMIMPRRRSNTCGAAWRSRSSPPVERGAARREAVCEGAIGRPAVPEGTCFRCTNTLVHLPRSVNEAPEEMHNEKRYVERLCGRRRDADVAAGRAGFGAAEGRDHAVAAAGHFLHALAHHGKEQTDREARRFARRSRRVNQMDQSERRRRADRCFARRWRRHPQHRDR